MEIASLKEKLERANTEKAVSDMLLAQVCEKLEQSVVRLNVAIVGRNRAEKSTHSHC